MVRRGPPLAELRTLRARERLADLRPGSSRFDDRYEVPTFEEILTAREQLCRRSGREIGVIPEIKHPTYLHDAGFEPEAVVVRLAERFGLNEREAPLWIQSFELMALQDLRARHDYRGRSTFLTKALGGPHDLRGRGTTWAELTTAPSLRRLAVWIDAISPEKDAVIARTVDGSLGEETGLVADAHDAGLEITPWTFRAENAFLPTDHTIGDAAGGHGRLADEVTRFYEAGVDGVFCDQPDICVAARERFLATI